MADLRTRFSETYPDIEIWAAGGIITRWTHGTLEVLLIHRPDHADWSFPKGKRDEGESLGTTAEREVLEETGFRCRRLDRLPEVCYPDARSRKKLVVYWTMAVIDGTFVPNSEVDAAGWFELAAAANILSYERDVGLLGAITTTESDPRMSS